MNIKNLILSLFLISTISSESTTRPNVIFFLVDDLGWKDLSCYGSTYYETPAIDRFASEGMRFTQAYSAHPRCVPSRHALQTGRFPARAGIPGRSYSSRPESVTIGEVFKDAGYKTFFAGKWHLGKTPDQMPDQQGYDINIAGGAAGAPGSYFYPYLKPKKNKKHKTGSPIMGLENGKEGEYLTDRLTDESIKFLKTHRKLNPDIPFFLYLSHYAVHTPLEGKPELVEKYESKKMNYTGQEYIQKDGTTKMRQDNSDYAAMVESTDKSLGRILETLKNLKIYTNTIIVLTSDHGGLSNRGKKSQRPLATSNLPLRAGKGHCYEGGIRVPLIVTAPGVSKPGSTSDAVVNGTDHFPTLLELAGLSLKPELHLDGESIVAVLKGKEFSRDKPLFWHSPKGRPSSTGDNNCSAIRKGNLKLIEYYDEGRIELYDISKDLSEKNNLAENLTDTAQLLLKELQDWKKSVNAFIDHRKNK